MPELLAHTNMDSQAMSKLRDYIEDFVKFLARNPEQYIAAPYESGMERHDERTPPPSPAAGGHY